MNSELVLFEITQYLQKIEKPESRPDDFNPSDAFGGNFDDAYRSGGQDGIEQGRYKLAQKLLKMIEN